ncbi:hypothetical protein UA08_02293 [Talaromyces atroroseus]|uniref:Luciferase domain-containing protein n=1 Tax=Talaromyces atroroseus TaxID=1441469 RepID=A0A225AQQ5_TALAT|nr:hypothetical protein UA08_02293 [Talaromyces atroroseus]OKL61833.1 hypothetical protein UA08_02293 [Talaromyces atroroseus]
MSENIITILQRHPLATASAAIALAAAIPAYRDYRLYKSYGAGGPPHNVVGWYVSRFIITPFRQESISTQMYEEAIDKGKSKSYISFMDGRLPRRKGGRPAIGSHAAPNRQTSQIPSDEMKEDLLTAFNDFAAKNSHLVRLAPSRLEGGHSEAMWLIDGIPKSPEAGFTKGELSHIHTTGDHSLHLILSEADAKEVIDAGWGQRHPIAGYTILGHNVANLPSTFLHVYAPRNQEELDVVMEIIRASVRNASLGGDPIP